MGAPISHIIIYIIKRGNIMDFGIYLWFATSLLLCLIVFVVIKSRKNMELSKSAKILCNTKMKLKMDSKYDIIAKYFPLALYLNIWGSLLYRNHNEGDIIAFIFTSISIGLILIFLHICNKHAKRKSKYGSKNTNLKKNKLIEVIKFDDFVDVQITDKGIMLKNMVNWRWNRFKGYSKDGNCLILIPKYSWFEPYVYLFNSGRLENIIKTYLKEIK